MIGRVSTFAAASYLMSLNANTQSKLNEAETEEASGLKAQSYGAMSGDVSKVLNVDNQVSRLGVDDDNATTALSTMQETYSVMGSVTDLASSMLSDLSSYMSGGTIDSSTVSSSAQSWLDELTSLMNTQYAGSYIFSGTSSDTAPVDTSSYDVTDASTADTSYYQGSSSGTSYTGSDGYTVTTSVQADDPGFEKLYRALSLLANGSTSSSDLSTAYSLIKEGSSEVASAQATLSSETSALTDYQSSIETKSTTLTTLASDLKDSDVASATVLVTNYQTQLEASYSAVSKLLSVSLAQYLN